MARMRVRVAVAAAVLLLASGLGSGTRLRTSAVARLGVAGAREECRDGGVYWNEEANACEPCPVGHKCVGGGEAEECTVNWFQPNPASTACVECPANMHTDGLEGQIKCQCDVLDGWIQSADGSCKRCDSGRIAREDHASCQQAHCPVGEAEHCPRGQPCDCFTCPKGHRCLRDVKEACPSDTFQPYANQGDCARCVLGTGTLGKLGQTGCVPLKGYYKRGEKVTLTFGAKRAHSHVTDKYHPCEKGHLCNDGVRVPCPVGTYLNQTTQWERCLPCPPGSYGPRTGMAVCLPCPAGQYQPDAGTTMCLPCPAGSYVDETGSVPASSCKPCPPGSYTGVTGTALCKPCSAGLQQPAAGATSCGTCPPGHHAPTPGTVNCVPCDPGTYQPSHRRAVTCSSCSPGWYQSGRGAANCERCPPGHVAPSSAAPSCSACPPGHYAGAGWANCQRCPHGHYQPSHGAGGCHGCPRGSSPSGSSRRSQCCWWEGHSFWRRWACA